MNLLHALRGCESWVGRLQRDNVLDNFAGKLVATLRPAQARQQAGETLLGERGLCVIERRARNAEGERRLYDRATFDAMPTQHLVAGLQKIARLEEGVVLEE